MGHRTWHHLAIIVWAISFGITYAIIGCIGLTSVSHHQWHLCMTSLQLHQSEREIELSRGQGDIPSRKGVKVIIIGDGTSPLLLISLSIKDIVRTSSDLPHLWLKAHLGKG